MATSTTSRAGRDPAEPDTSIASESAAQAAVDASALTPDADRVAMVSRDKDGNPDQSQNYTVIGITRGSPDAAKRAANNEDGEALGAKNVTKDA